MLCFKKLDGGEEQECVT